MKVALLNDTHIGVRNSSDKFYGLMRDFFFEQFIPYCNKNDIKQVLHLGDWFDVRRFTEVKAKVFSREIIAAFRENNIKMDIIIGNHDVYYKNTNKFSALVEILSKESDVVTIYTKPTEVAYENAKVLLIPWINQENYDECVEAIKNSTSPICAGHFEMPGFAMMKAGKVSTSGLELKMFSHYDEVWSGHYHTQSQRENVHYLGTQFELTWADCEDEKGFFVFDTNTFKKTRVINKQKVFYKIRYDERIDKDPRKLEIEKDAFIKIIPIHAESRKQFDRYVEMVEQFLEPHSLGVVYPLSETGEVTEEDKEELLVDTPTFLHRTIHEMYDDSKDYDADKLSTFALEIYNEALAQDTTDD